MKIFHKLIQLQTKEELEFVDITDQVKLIIQESQVKDGLVNIQSLHTTAVLVVNENEPLLIRDLKKHLEELSSKNLQYNHDNFAVRTVNMCDDECVNGHSHCKAVHLQTNVTLNLIGGELQLGQWQRTFLVELDRSRPRKIQVQIIGE